MGNIYICTYMYDIYDEAMGSFDGAKTCDLVGIYILSEWSWG
jgi:hypothetical protein